MCGGELASAHGRTSAWRLVSGPCVWAELRLPIVQLDA